VDLRKLGNTDMEITPVGFGAWAIGGGGWKYAWGPQDDQDSIATIHRALDAGMNWIDTAEVYGLGHSEEVVGQALKGISHKPYIFTKCGRWWDENRTIIDDQSAAGLRQQVEDSLRRLQVDVIDLYQVHWPRPEAQLEEGWRTLEQIRQEGKVRAIGVSNYNVAQMERILPIATISTLQPPYSMLRTEIEDSILPFCQQHNIGVLVYSPMQSGLLTGSMTQERIQNLPDDDWRKRDSLFQEPQLSRNLALADLLASIGAAHGRTPGEVAITWTLRHPAVTAAIVGARHPGQIDGIIGAQEFRLSAAEIEQIAEFIEAHPVRA